MRSRSPGRSRPGFVCRGLVLCAAAAAGSAARAQTCAEEPICYVERQLRADAPEGGRRMRARTNRLHGIDVNSSVDIEIDEPLLTDEVLASLGDTGAGEDVRALGDALEALRASAAGVDGIVESLRELLDAFARAESADEYRAAVPGIRDVQQRVAALLESLERAMTLRLRRTGLGAANAAREADAALGSVLAEQGVLYDWPALRRILAEEIEWLERELTGVAAGTGLELEIQAHLLQGGPTGTPIFLPGYNEVAAGPSTIVRKVRYEIPPEAVALRDRHQALAEELDEQRDLGEAVLAALEARYEQQARAIESLLAEAGGAADAFAEALGALGRFADAAAREEWFDAVEDRLARTEAGRAVAARWADVEAALEALETDAEVLRELGDIGESLEGAASAEDALTILQQGLAAPLTAPGAAGVPPGLRALNLGVWRQRADVLAAFGRSVAALDEPLRDELTAADGPVAAFDAVRAAAVDFSGALAALPASARELLFESVAVESARFAATLPTPASQRRLGLTPAARLDTSFDLKTSTGTRDESDEIWISYTFFRGEQELGLGWRDRFMIRKFGWQDRVTAGLAFARAGDAETWEPTANLSWILRKRRWPEDGETGLGGVDSPQWYSGFGLSTMPLDFDETEDVEIGVALTLSFLDNRIMIGRGTNLQVADDDEFTFISLRLFENAGVMKAVPGR